MSDLWLRSVRDYLPLEIKLDVAVDDYLFLNNNAGYIQAENKSRILALFTQKIKENKEYENYIFSQTMKRMEDLEKLADEINASVGEEPDNNVLLDHWRTLEEHLLKVIPWFYIPWYLTEEDILTQWTKEKLRHYTQDIEKVTDFNNALGILLFPTKQVAFQKEQKHFYELVDMAKKSSDFEKDVEFIECANEYLDKFSWVKVYLFLPIEPLTYKELIKKVQNALDDDSLDDFKKQEEQRAKNEKIRTRLEKIIKDDEELMDLVARSRELGWLLTASVEEAFWGFYKLLPFFKKLASGLGVAYEDWVYLTSEEIQKRLEGEGSVPEEDLEQRKHAYVALMKERRIYWLTGNKAKELTEYGKNTIGEIDESITEFSGHPGYPGKVSGKVHIAFTPTDAHKIDKGAILVTSMTSPEYLSAMKRSVAIITDEGGLLSHAAIVARELGIPCVVGTKIATKVLKDGDEAEVDADSGVVKILKKHE